MLITKKIVADKIAAYLHHDITLVQLVDWAEHAMMEDEFEESGLAAIRSAVSRLGVADVRAFGLTWGDCEELLGQLGFSARVSIITAYAGRYASRTCNASRLADLDFHHLAHGASGLDERIQLNRKIVGVEHAVELRAAGGHLRGHGGLGQAGRLHAFSDLLGQRPLERARLHLVVNAFFFQEVVEAAACVWVTFRHASTP